MYHTSRGFTLIEIILSISVLLTLLGVTSALAYTTVSRVDVTSAQDTFVQAIYNAQIRAQNNSQASAWGVRVDSSQVVLFQGTSYATRNEEVDTLFPLASQLEISGDREYVFAKHSGLPTATGQITFSGTVDNAITININAYGVPEKQ